MPKAKEHHDELVTTARELGVSERQLRRWRTETGLLPSPIETSGRGRGLGKDVYYPAGTCEQLRALAECVQLHPRSLVDAGWRLWLRGYNGVDAEAHEVTEFIRRALLGVLQDVEIGLRTELRRLDDPKSDDFFSRVERGAETVEGALFENMSKRQLSRLFRVGLFGVLGKLDKEDVSRADRRLLGKALVPMLGLFRLLSLVDDGDEGDEEGFLDAAGKAFDELNITHIRGLLEDIPAQDLESAREEAKRLRDDWDPEWSDDDTLPGFFLLVVIVSHHTDFLLVQFIDATRVLPPPLNAFAQSLINFLLYEDTSFEGAP